MAKRRQVEMAALACAVTLGTAACEQDPAAHAESSASAAAVSATGASAASASATASPSSAPPTAAKAARAPAPVSWVARFPGGTPTRVVFLDQAHHCPCNADHIAFAWQVVDKIRQARPALKVERVHADVDRKREAKLRKKQNFWAFPAIYVFDAQGRVVGLVQGDLKEAEIQAALR